MAGTSSSSSAFGDALNGASPSSVHVRRQLCRFCRASSERVDDAAHGSNICTNCGCSGFAWERAGRDVLYGEGAGQYSAEGSAQSLELDDILRERAREGGNTTKVHKQALLRRAQRIFEMDAHSDRHVDVATRIFQAYSDMHKQVRQFALVAQACLASAERLLRHESLGPSGVPMPEFECNRCSTVFNCRKDLRTHRCSEAFATQPKFQTSAETVAAAAAASIEVGVPEALTPTPAPASALASLPLASTMTLQTPRPTRQQPQ